TFFLEFSIGANYAMRGSILPIFTLTYLATPVISGWLSQIRSIPLYALVAAYLLGGVSEYASFCRMSMLGFFQSNTPFNALVLKFNQGDSRVNRADLALRAQSIEDGFGWYLLERNRPTKQHINGGDLLSMGGDNPYRITASTIIRHR